MPASQTEVLPFPPGYVQKMPNENSLKYRNGQPISLEDKPAEGVVDKTLSSIADLHVLDEYRRDSGKPAEKITDSDLQRQVRTARLQDEEPDKKLEQMDSNIKDFNEQASKAGLIDKLLFKIGLAEGPLDRRDRQIARKEEFLQSVAAERRKIEDIQKTIESDPGLLEKAIDRAYEEAEAVQRIALGQAIRAVNGDKYPSAEQAQQFADLYNAGKFRITDKQLVKAQDIYSSMITWFGRTSMRELNGQPLTEDLVRHLYSPVKQVQQI